jgi:beta-glucosidase
MMPWRIYEFEWVFGYGPKFGIIAVDRATQERRPKPSAHWLGNVARNNALPIDMTTYSVT